MSDSPQGEGWWLAVDGKYYAPELHPEYRAPAPPPSPQWQAPTSGYQPYGSPPAAHSYSSGPTTLPHTVAFSGAPGSSTPASSGEQWFHSWWAIVPGLLFCFPVGLGLLWTSRKENGVKIGVSVATAVLLIIGAVSSSGDDSGVDEDVEVAGAVTTSTSLVEAPTTAEAAAVATTAPSPTTPATTAAPATAPPTTSAPPTAPPTAAASISQQNAKRKAASYLEMMAFSRAGLIGQLEFEGFTTEDATYGVDANNPDWNEQAAKKAASYLEMMAFSRSGLIEQLVFEGFTQSEAEYGVGTTGL